MSTAIKNIIAYRDLIDVLARKNTLPYATSKRTSASPRHCLKSLTLMLVLPWAAVDPPPVHDARVVFHQVCWSSNQRVLPSRRCRPSYAALPAYVPSRVPPDLLKNARYEQQRTAARDLQGLSVARCHKDGIADVQVEAQSYRLVDRVCLATVATAAAAVRAQLTISRIS